MKNLISSIIFCVLVVISPFTQASDPINDTLRHFVGELFGGGVVFYLDETGKHGLICSISDIISTETNPMARNPSQRQMINRTSSKTYMHQTSSFDEAKNASRICEWYTNSDFGTGIYSDWFLPDINQLERLYNVKDKINTALEIYLKDNKYNLHKLLYWSSSHSHDDLFPGNFLLDFNSGTRVGLRGSSFRGTYVRAVRTF